MFKIITQLTLSLGLMLSVTQSHAAFSLNGTRVILNEQSSSSVVVFNHASARYGMQAWVEDANGKDPGKALVVTPNFQAIDGQQKAVLRLLSFTPPGNQEQMYYLDVQEIPPKPTDNGHSQLSMAVRTKIKVIIRPTALVATRKDAEDKIQVTRNGQGLTFKNPTPYYFAITNVKAGGKTFAKTPLGTFAPFSTIEMKNISSSASAISVSYLNDYGATQTANLKIQ